MYAGLRDPWAPSLHLLLKPQAELVDPGPSPPFSAFATLYQACLFSPTLNVAIRPYHRPRPRSDPSFFPKPSAFPFPSADLLHYPRDFLALVINSVCDFFPLLPGCKCLNGRHSLILNECLLRTNHVPGSSLSILSSNHSGQGDRYIFL